MKVRSTIFCLMIAMALSGCHKQSSPQFRLSSNTEDLASYARDAVQTELEAGFGTPADFVVWPQLPVDFGTFTGQVGRVLQSGGGGSVVLAGEGLSGVSENALNSRLESLAGAAVLIVSGSAEVTADEESGESESGDASEPVVLRVESYDPDTRTLQLVDDQGNPATVDAQEGDTVQVVGDALQFGRELYHRHCVHCHGSAGDGDGPTAKYFNVRPRDYRKGIFKFTSTKDGVRASRDDLYRIVKLGAPGTYMPSFMLLPDDEVNAIVEYIRWLSMRGEMEGKLYVEFFIDHSKAEPAGKAEFNEYWSEDAADIIEMAGEELHDDWTVPEEEDSQVVPGKSRTEPTADSIKRGRLLYMNKDKGNCFSCHGETGKGNGPSTEILNKLPGSEELADEPGLFDVWGNPVKPRNLTRGIYRGGRRPVDIYRRIYAGIKGTPMPGYGAKMNDDDIWDLVNYVLSVPTEK